MPRVKRTRSDSYATEAAMASAKPPTPPDHIEMPQEAMAHWWPIVRARAYKDWTGPDLEHAANLAICLYDLECERKQLRTEGYVITNEKGTPIQNPRNQVIEVLSRRSVALSKLVHVHAEATSGKSRDEQKRSQKQREMTAMVESIEAHDGLIKRH
jgi:hypothetical protein